MIVLDFDSIAARYGMRIRNIALETPETRSQRGQVGADTSDYQSVILSFSVTGDYNAFRSFLEDLEQSLRLVDVVSIAFSSSQTGLYDYAVAVKTYWLKP